MMPMVLFAFCLQLFSHTLSRIQFYCVVFFRSLVVCKSHGYCRNFELISRLFVCCFFHFVVVDVARFFSSIHKLDWPVQLLRLQYYLPLLHRCVCVNALTVKHLQILFTFHFHVHWSMLFWCDFNEWLFVLQENFHTPICLINSLSLSFYMYFVQITQHTNGSVSISTLTFRPIPDDDGTILKCEGSNPRLPNSALEDSLVFIVMCKSSNSKTLVPCDSIVCVRVNVVSRKK